MGSTIPKPRTPLVSASRWDGWAIAAAAVGLGVVAACCWRLVYGVDFTDEAYYVAVPYRFVLGARPFIDETTPSQQTTALLIYPFIAAYHALIGVRGIILAARGLHLLFTVLVAGCVFIGLRPFVRTFGEALLPALVPIAFVPFSLPDPSYNNVGSGLLVAGSFLGLRFLSTHGRRALVASGLATGLAVFAYPTLLLPAVGLGAVVAWRAGTPRRRALAGYGIPALAPIAALAGVVAWSGVGHVRAVYAHAQEFGGQGGGLGKLGAAPGALVEVFRHVPLGVVALALLVLLWRARSRHVIWLAPFLPLLLVPLLEARGPHGALDYVTSYGAAALPLYLLVRRDQAMTTVFLAVWPAAALGGLATYWSSNNGSSNLGVGLAGAPIVTTVLVVAVCSHARPELSPDVRRFAALFAGSTVVIALVVFQFTWVYRDGAFTSLGARIASGPYAGISTTPGRRRFVGTLGADLTRISAPRCRILFYDEFPAGYLISPSRPYTNAVFLLLTTKSKLGAYRRLLLDYYRAKQGLPDVVVRMFEVPGMNERDQPAVRLDPLGEVVGDPRVYDLVRRRPAYAIYVHRGSRCLGPHT